MKEEEKDLVLINRTSEIMKKLEKGTELTEEEQEYLKNPQGVLLKKDEPVEEVDVVEDIASVKKTKESSILSTTLEDYLSVSRVSGAIRNQMHTRAYMLHGAQFFATIELIKETKKLYEAITNLIGSKEMNPAEKSSDDEEPIPERKRLKRAR